MRQSPSIISMATAVAALTGTLALAPMTVQAADASVVEQGKAVSFDRKKGNCLACHQIEGGSLPGNIGPPLVAMKARFPDRKKLFNQIYDASSVNASTRMPPFGKHKALSNADIDHIVDYLYTL